MAETIKIEGLRELQRNLAKLSGPEHKRATKQALIAGARVIKGAVKAKAAQQPTLADAPYRIDDRIISPGEIARQVVVTKAWDANDGSSGVAVGVKSTKANGYIGRIASFNEFGTTLMSPQPFMRPGFESSKEAALGAIVAALRDGLDKP